MSHLSLFEQNIILFKQPNSLEKPNEKISKKKKKIEVLTLDPKMPHLPHLGPNENLLKLETK